MQVDRISAELIAAANDIARGRVCGLGLCDVLRVELDPCQIAGLIDELEKRRMLLHDALSDARETLQRLRESACPSPEKLTAYEQLVAEAAYDVSVLLSLRAQAGSPYDGEGGAIVGPSRMICEVVAGAAMSAADAVTELVNVAPGGSAWRAGLRAATAACAAWAETHASCHALECFTFEPSGDPGR